MNTDTWTRGPVYPVASCRRCGASVEPEDVASGFCWHCGDMGALEFKDEIAPHLDAARKQYRETLNGLADR